MGRVCCVSNCSNARRPGRPMMLHRFPNDPERALKWLDLIGRPDLKTKDFKQIRQSVVICHAHFSEKQTFFQIRNRTNLKATAVPDLLLPEQEINSNVSNVIQELVKPTPTYSQEENTAPNNVIQNKQIEPEAADSGVHNCILCEGLQLSTNVPVVYHNFPSNETHRLQWLEFCGIPKESFRPTSKLCSLHFATDDYNIIEDVATLKHDAIPTITTSQLKLQYDQVDSIYKFMHCICRICLSSQTVTKVENLNTVIGDLTKLETFHNKMPQQLCKTCLSELEYVNVFIEKVKTASQLLNDVIEVVEGKNRTDTTDEEKSDDAETQQEKSDDGESQQEKSDDGETQQEDESSLLTLLPPEILDAIDLTQEHDETVSSNNAGILRPNPKTKKFQQRKKQVGERKIFYICKREDYYNGKIEPVHKITQPTRKCSRCPKCNRTFPFMAFLQKHMKQQHPPPPKKLPRTRSLCHICGKTVWYIRNHVETHSVEEKYMCQYCGAKKTSQYSLAAHIRAQHKPHKYNCGYCSKTFYRRARLREHMRVHEKTQHACSICGKVYTTQNGLKDHYNTHTGEKPFKCKTCGAAFAVRSTFFAHRKWHKIGEIGPPSLAYCRNKPWPYGEEKSENEFSCGSCSETFQRRIHLIDHMRTHKPTEFACNICGKLYATKYGLKDHYNTHTGEKPFKCKICGADFAIRSTYFAHTKWHKLGEICAPGLVYYKDKKWPSKQKKSGVTLYECGVCGKKFRQKLNCKNHVNSHANEGVIQTDVGVDSHLESS